MQYYKRFDLQLKSFYDQHTHMFYTKDIMSFIEIQHIRKYYTSSTSVIPALHDVCLSIHQGEILSLLGVNGAGKSTLSSIIATLHPATSGDILFQGTSIYHNLELYRSEIGYCPQKPNLAARLSLYENLVFAGRFYGLSEELIHQRIAYLAEQFELTKYLQHTADILSGGYKQRFMIARSLIHEPQLLILDEPTVGLDPHIRRHLWDVIKALKQQGMTILLTTHYLDEAEVLSDRVCILDKGKIILIDTPDALKAQYQQDNLEDMFIKLLGADERV